MTSEITRRAKPEIELMRIPVGREAYIRLLAGGGDIGHKEIGRLIKILEVQRKILEDDEQYNIQNAGRFFEGNAVCR